MPIDFTTPTSNDKKQPTNPKDVLDLFGYKSLVVNLQPSQQQRPEPQGEIRVENLNLSHKQDEDILFREEITKGIMTTLLTKDKPNVILVGPNGVGKTKIVEDLAQKIENKKPVVPTILHDAVIYNLRLSDLVANSGVVGELENKLNLLINFLTEENTDRILFIDEIHLLCSNDSQYTKIGEILKPELSRGNISIIGATTTNEYKNIEDDPAFKRRFTRINVNEFDKTQTITILKKSINGFMNHYEKLIVPKETDFYDNLYNLANYYKTADQHEPDNSLSLLDQTLANLIIENPDNDTSAIEIGYRDVENLCKKRINGYKENTDFDESLFKENTKHILGQNGVLKELKTTLKRYEKPIFPKEKPLTLLFLGDSGTGKTAVAKAIAKTLTESKPIYLNMTEYTTQTSQQRLIGVDNGFVGSTSKKERPFDILSSTPKQVIILDEFEKAHPLIQNLFMQAIDEGYITDAQGKVINFKQSILILTSNAGYNKSTEKVGFGVNDEPDVLSKNELLLHLDPALVNRIDNYYHFKPVTKDLWIQIAKNVYQTKKNQVLDKALSEKLPKNLTPSIVNKLAEKHFNYKDGARQINAIIENYIYEKL